MSSFAASANLSTETSGSAIMHSGLNISVGDTKSIVLALQALQGKIRALEQDRDLHRDQYDRILQSHEAYKFDMEHQLERERAAHRRREDELLELLRKAQEEKSRMEGSLNGNRDDLSAFKKEIEEMIESEKSMSRQRELKLQTEITRLQREISDERARYNILLHNVEQLKVERNAIQKINLNMQETISALQHLRCNKRQQQQQQPQQRRRRAMMALNKHGPGPPQGPSSVAPKEVATHCRVYSTRCNGYQEPTCNSRLRDMRNAFEEGSCVCEKVNLGYNGSANITRPHTCRDSLSHRQGRSSSAYSVMRNGSQDISALPSHPLSYGKLSSSRSPRNHGPGQQRGVYHHDNSVPQTQNNEPVVDRVVRKNNVGIDEVERKIDEELDELQKEYQTTISRALVEKLPHDVVSEALQRLSLHIDRKMEQLDLLRAAGREIGAARTPAAHGDVSSAHHTTTDKEIYRNRLVNELRSMLTQSAEKQ